MIYLIWAPPSEGKSYIGTHLGVNYLLNSNRKVYSNYPIVYHKKLPLVQRGLNIGRKLLKKPVKPEKIFSSLKWEENYIYMGIHDSVIILDEAYMYKGFSSRHKMTDDQHSFFATTGHDNNLVYLIAQHYNRLELIMRENANYWIFVRKTNNPLSRVVKEGEAGREGELKPLFFNAEYYLSEDDFKFRRIHKTEYKIERIWFNKRVAMAYDTKKFRKPSKPFKPVSWLELEKENIELIMAEEQKSFEQAIEEFSKPIVES